MASVHLKTGSLGCAIGVAALILTANAATAQFFPFFQQQPQRPPQPPQPQPQQSRPAQPAQRPAQTAPAPAKKAQPPAQKAQSPAAPKPAPATAAAPFGEVRTACATEIRSTCAGVVPGSAESVQCLRPNFAVHSPPCQAALSRAASVAAQPAATPDPKTQAPAGTADSPRIVSTDRVAAPSNAQDPLKDVKFPTMRPTQEARFVNRHCKEDHSLLCQGVTFGQSRVLKCLASHQSSLTNECRNALANP